MLDVRVQYTATADLVQVIFYSRADDPTALTHVRQRTRQKPDASGLVYVPSPTRGADPGDSGLTPAPDDSSH